ncbi:hypothetical protein [Virgisporangium aurantiacum]|uniref:Uncharacterized protein n=1 Tax=Virgisporangium aurantiacum TaxID=175570 RepID=A0A8J3ZGS1_9ACTN|nr:hypothetical protein [Virgisporangium aurantiacum]GIJ63874.1 hypothetical protein Vau01_113900 [Virgisporangium aurantiacum]
MWIRPIAIASAAVVAIGAFAVLTASVPAPTLTGADRQPLRFGPSWLPDGLTELGREYGAPVRQWALEPFELSARWQTLDLRPPLNGLGSCPFQRDPVDINGRPGWFREGSSAQDLRGVCWQFDRHTYLQLDTTLPTLTRKDLIRIARSVRPAAGTFSFPISVPPDALRPFGLDTDPGLKRITGRSSTDWTASGYWSPGSRYKPRPVLKITVGPATEAPDGGQPRTVRGRPARYVLDYDSPAGNSSYLVIDLGARHYLTIQADTDPPSEVAFFDLAAVAERTTVDLSRQRWIGARDLTG